MIHAYKETYLSSAANKFGNMMNYAVNDYDIDGDRYLHMFISSGLAQQFERGNPKFIAGLSGIDLATETIRFTTGKTPTIKPTELDYRTAEYWGGWALARYQWYSSLRFASILRCITFSDILDMYPTLHEADITKFISIANELYIRANPQTNLKRIREINGLSQSKLAKEADVSLRSIQMYEQRNKDINKAKVITIVKIAQVLGCNVEDLMEITISH